MEENENFDKNEPNVYFVQNAALALLSPFFPRLFAMLGYLNENRKEFKDIESQVRAMFLLQYLVCPEEKEYSESELTFNCLLVSLPPQVPTPKRVELTDEERQTADSMLVSVKTNWEKIKSTSANGFRQSFIIRNGRMEQQEDKWLLTVDDRPFDVLLDSLPWSFKLIRFPWMKQYVQVVWRDR